MALTDNLKVKNSILLPVAPTEAMHATTKQYVDTGLSTKANSADLGTAAVANTGTASGNVPVLCANSKLPVSVIPAATITDTFTVSSEAAMLALQAQSSDIAIRTDISQTFILTAEPASTLSNWAQLLSPIDNMLGEGNKISVSFLPTASSITNDANTVPTTAAVFDAIGDTVADSKYTTTITGDGTMTDFVVTHNLSAVDAQVDVFEGTGTTLIPIMVLVARTSANVATVKFAIAPTAAESFTVTCRK